MNFVSDFRQSREFIKTREHIRKPFMESENVAKRKPQASSEAKESKAARDIDIKVAAKGSSDALWTGIHGASKDSYSRCQRIHSPWLVT